MNELDGDRAFADTRSDAFDGTVADIADDKDAGDTGLHQPGVAFEGPGFGAAIAEEILAGEDKAAVVALNHATEPIGAGHGADEDEEGGCRHGVAFAADAAAQGDGLEARFAVEGFDGGSVLDVNI